MIIPAHVKPGDAVNPLMIQDNANTVLKPGANPRMHSSNRDTYLLGILLFVAVCIQCVFYYNLTLEDAHITFRYSLHLAEGYGLGSWNVGESPVEGFTSPLWTVVLGCALALGLSPFVISKCLGAAALLSMVALCLAPLRHRGAERQGEQRFLFIAATMFALYLPLSWYAMSGMEAVPFAALTNALLVAPFLFSNPNATCLFAAVVSPLLVAMRPEGTMIALAINGYYCIEGKFGDHKQWAALLPLASSLLGLAAIVLIRYRLFGTMAPNTYYAKGEGGYHHIVLGLAYIASFAMFASSFWIAALLGLVRSRPSYPYARFMCFLAGLLLVYAVYLIKVGGDPESAFPMWRHFVHIAPIWIFLTALMLEHWCKNLKRGCLVAVGVVAGTDLLIAYDFPAQLLREPGLSIVRDGPFAREKPNPYFVWLDGIADNGTLTAAALAGQWGWYVPGRQIDMLGLNNYHIAHFGHSSDTGPVDSKTDMGYVLALKPDILDGYMSGTSLSGGVCPSQLRGFRAAMLDELIDNPSFRRDYLFVRNAPYDHLDRAVFVRTAYIARRPHRGLDMVPVGNTVLYQAGCGHPDAATPNRRRSLELPDQGKAALVARASP